MLRVRDSIVNSSDGASLYNVICKTSASNGECFNTIAQTFSNITGDKNVSKDNTGDIVLPNIDSAFASIENDDYRVKESYAQEHLVDSEGGKGINGSYIVSWAYYDDSVSDVEYSLSLDGFNTKTSADAGRITKDSVASVGGAKNSTRLPDLKLTRDYDALGQGARAFFDASQNNLQHQRAMRFNSTKARLSLTQTILTKDWMQNLSSTTARAQSDTVRLIKDWFIKQLPATVSVNGDAVQMEYVELFHYVISLGSLRSAANVGRVVATKDQTVGLCASKALVVGGTMYVYRDIQSKLNGVAVSSETDKLEVAADRLMTVGTSSAGTFATSNMLIHERTLSVTGALTMGVTGELDIFANVVVPLSQTNKISGYSVSFEINPISVIYDFE